MSTQLLTCHEGQLSVMPACQHLHCCLTMVHTGGAGQLLFAASRRDSMSSTVPSCCRELMAGRRAQHVAVKGGVTDTALCKFTLYMAVCPVGTQHRFWLTDSKIKSQIIALACMQVIFAIFQTQNSQEKHKEQCCMWDNLLCKQLHLHITLTGFVWWNRERWRSKSLFFPFSTVPVHDLQAAPGFCCPKPGSLHSCSLHSTDDNTSALELYRPDLHFYFLLPVNISCQSRACKPNYTPLLDCLILKICHEVIYDTNYWEGGGWMHVERKLIYIKCNQFPE